MDKVLYINNINSPFETYSGANQRSYLILESLIQKYEVDVLCFTYDEAPKLPKDKCKIYFYPIEKDGEESSRVGSSAVFPKNTTYSTIAKELISKNEYKFIIVRYIQTIYLCGLENINNLVTDIDDLPEQLYKSVAFNSKFPKNIKKYFLSLFARYYSNKIIKKSLQVYLPNIRQCKYKNSIYLPNIPFPFFNNKIILDIPFIERKPIVLFVGVMNWGVNINGIDHFIRHSWDEVKKKVPDAVLKIIGKNPPEDFKTKWENTLGVEVLGFVDDLYFEYSNCRCIIVPVYTGSGTNIKVLEAMTTGRSCVISKHASRGFEDDLIDGKNIMISTDNTDFAKKVIITLTDKEIGGKLAINAKSVIHKKYSFDYFSSQLLQGVL